MTAKEIAEATAIAKGMDDKEIFALNYHAEPDRRSSCGDMGLDLGLMFQGLAKIDNDARITLTPLGQQVRAILETKP